MDIEKLEGIYYHDTKITNYKKIGKDAILEFNAWNNYKIIFKNVRINEDMEERIAFDLGVVSDYFDDVSIEFNGVEFGKINDNKYYFKAYLQCIPEKYFDYSKLGKKKIDYQGEIFYGEEYYEDELPVMSIICDDIIVQIDGDINENSGIYINNLEKINNINFHDGDIYNYERDGNNISFEIKDGWIDCLYYKIELENVSVQVMNNNPEYICYILDVFNNCIKNDEQFNLYFGEADSFIDSDGMEKYYLKFWIRCPDVKYINCKVTSGGYKFDDMDVELCNDYDDTGMLYIKFIADNINVKELYPLLKKYSRVSNENMNNLSRYKEYLGENEYKFFSAIDLTHLFLDYTYKDNDFKLKFRDILNLNDIFTLSFINVSSELDEIDIDSFIANNYDNERKLSNCIRFIEYKNNKYFIGLLLSMEDEFVFTCDNIIFDGNKIDSRSILD